MSLLKTNSKKYQDNFKNYFVELFKDNTSGYINSIDEFLTHFNSEFNFDNNKKRIPNLQNRLASYLQGMPYGFNFCYNEDFLSLAAELHEIEKVPADKEKVIIKNFYNHCAAMFLKLANKETVNKLY